MCHSTLSYLLGSVYAPLLSAGIQVLGLSRELLMDTNIWMMNLPKESAVCYVSDENEIGHTSSGKDAPYVSSKCFFSDYC